MRIRSITIIFVAIIIISCKTTDSSDEIDPKILQDNKYLLSLLESWYLWNNEIDSDQNAANFESPQDLLDQVKYSQLDRWSSISDAAQFTTYYDEGTYLGYGFFYNWDDDNNVRFGYTYNNSPFGKAGIKRGYKLLKIDGVDVQTISDWSNIFGVNEIGFTQSFLIEDLDGNQAEYQISKDIVTINTVLHADTLSVGNETVGYLVFETFINPAREELDEAFGLFQSAEIDRLILDMRYNGGGQVSVATYLANYIIGQENNGQLLFKYQHNEGRTANNQVYALEKFGVLEIDELIILTTERTASASELILNGLKPLMTVTHIGVGNTYGKPVGSYGWYSLDESEVYSIISFSLVNSNDIGDYFDGIEPDFTACDDLKSPFGDTNESLFGAAIEYVATGQTGGCDLVSKLWENRLELPQEQPNPILILNQ